MANIFCLPDEWDFSRLFGFPSDRTPDQRVDLDTFSAGMATVNSQFRTLGLYKPGSRANPHRLSFGFLEDKGLNLSGLSSIRRWHHIYWFCTFDMPKTDQANEPNGRRRIICLCRNDKSTDDGRDFYSCTNGGEVAAVLYTATHYGDFRRKNKKTGKSDPAFVDIRNNA